MDAAALQGTAAALRQLGHYLIMEGFGDADRARVIAAATPEILRIEHETPRGQNTQAPEPETRYCTLCGRMISLAPGTTWPWRMVRAPYPGGAPEICARSIGENRRHIPE